MLLCLWNLCVLSTINTKNKVFYCDENFTKASNDYNLYVTKNVSFSPSKTANNLWREFLISSVFIALKEGSADDYTEHFWIIVFLCSNCASKTLTCQCDFYLCLLMSAVQTQIVSKLRLNVEVSFIIIWSELFDQSHSADWLMESKQVFLGHHTQSVIRVSRF